MASHTGRYKSTTERPSGESDPGVGEDMPAKKDEKKDATTDWYAELQALKNRKVDEIEKESDRFIRNFDRLDKDFF